MAIDIKSIPVLTKEAAADFEKKVEENTSKRSSIDFSEENKIAEKILEKAKI